MPNNVKLNAEGVEAARAVLVEGRDNFATFEQHAAGIVRAYLAALDNSKPTPAGDDELVVAWRVRQRIFELKNKWSGWFVSEDRPEWGDGSDVEYQPLVPASSLAALTKEIAFWQVDDAAAWDKCEEQRIAKEKLEAALAAAHSQHEADVARIAELTQTLQRIFNVLTYPVDSSISPRRWHPHISDPNGSVEYVAEIAEAALANRKETK